MCIPWGDAAAYVGKGVAIDAADEAAAAWFDR